MPKLFNQFIKFSLFSQNPNKDSLSGGESGWGGGGEEGDLWEQRDLQGEALKALP